MTRRIMMAIIGVAALAVLAFGVPLGIAVRQVEHDDVFSTLQREAARTAAVLPSQLHGPDKVEVPRREDSDEVLFAVYDAAGKRVAGEGPGAADRVVRAALSGRLSHYQDAHQVSVGWPLTANEKTYGAVRAALPEAGVAHRVRTAWALMAALGGAVVLIAAALAWRQARRLAGPVDALASAATRLGHEDFTVTVDDSGIPELDRAGQALAVTAGRLGRLLERERSFSADASHQLRTPLTGLRLVLESAAASAEDPRPALTPALAEVDRLEATVDDLLRMARRDRPTVIAHDLAPVISEVVGRWQPRARDQDRRIGVDIDADLSPARLSPAALRQILDVLLSNALTHGTGHVLVSARPTPGGVVVQVDDQGDSQGLDPDWVFERGVSGGNGHGIGLALARTLAEAEGSRLALDRSATGTSFRLLVPAGGLSG